MIHHLHVRRLTTLALAVGFLPGCVPVSQPLSDPGEAKPDQRLFGRWKTDHGKIWKIQPAEGKGRPKGLMYSKMDEDPAKTMWFFRTVIGKYN